MTGDWLQALTEASTDAEREAIVMAMSLATLSPKLRQTLEAAAVPHWFDADFLDVLLGEDSDELYDQLLSLSFVEMAPGRGYAVHERTRKQLLRDMWGQDPGRFRELSAIAADYCAEQTQTTEDGGWEAEAIYHRLVSDPEAGVAGLRTLATKWADSEYHTYDDVEFTVRLAEEQIEAGRLSGAGEAWTRLWGARLALIFGRPELAPALMDQIKLKPDGDPFLSAELAQTRGDMLAQLGDEAGMEAAWRDAYDRYSLMENGSGQLDAFLVAEKMRAAGLADPEAETAVVTTPTPPGKDALQLIDNIEYAWIDGVLKTAVDETLKLRMAHGGGLTSNLVFHNPQGIDRPVSSGRLSRLFTAADGSMLILGAPGSGKTITLLQLLEELLDEARIDGDAPIPLLFNLSSFGAYAQENDADLTGWVADQAYKQYRLNRETTRQQLEAGTDIILLLDGLDEVPLPEREICVEAINQFVQNYPCQLVVCSRIGDYQALHQKLALNHALVLQPLSNNQIAASIEQQAEPQRYVMQAQIKNDWQLREALRSPLLLSLYPRAFPALDGTDWLSTDSVEARRQALFAAYVDTVFTQPETAGSMPDIAPDEASRNEALQKEGNKTRCEVWLAYLAGKMQEAGTTLFYVEDLQPQWLPQALIGRYRLLYGLILGSILGVIVIFGAGLIILLDASPNGSDSILPSEVMAGLAGGLSSIFAVALPIWLTSRLKRAWIQFAIGWAASWLIIALMSQLIYFEPEVNFALFFSLGISVSTGISSMGLMIELRERVKIQRPSASRIWYFCKTGALYGLIVGVIGGPIVLSTSWGILLLTDLAIDPANSFLSGPSSSGFYSAIICAPICGGFGILFGLIGGLVLAFLDTPAVDDRPNPGQGVGFSLRNAVLWTLIATLFFGLPTWFIMTRFFDQSLIAIPLVVGNIIILTFTWFGGLAWSQHMALRILLSGNNWLPRQLVPWLDEMAALGLLRRVGGGYIFIHRSLLEYFAALE